MPRLYPQKQVTEALRSLRARGWGISIIHQVATQQNMSVVELAAAVEAADRERANRGLSNAILNGSMCQACGVFFKSEPGYPRVCRSCAAELEIKDAIIAEDEV